jgi:hypothetical protein
MATVVVAGAIANKVHNGGEAWVRLSWIEGLARLGCEVVFAEQIDSASCVGTDGEPAPFAESANRAYFAQVMKDFGLQDRSALICTDTGESEGMDAARLADVAAGADLLVNVSGHLRLPAVLPRFQRRAYVDLDPGFTQIWHEQGADLGLGDHELHFTVGENIGRPVCDIPTAGFDWLPVPPPVVLDRWPVASDGDACRFTTVAGWRGAFGRVEHDGRSYGLKVHEFRKVIDLPARAPALTFELALDIHPGDYGDRTALELGGWRLVDPRAASRGPHEFHDYVQGSGAEFSVAQGIYVETHSGWFSDRTVRYLASGRPALVQDTGFSSNYPATEGLVAFDSVGDAAAQAKRIAEDHQAHSAAARALAEERFDSDLVLARFLEQAGVS